MIYKNLEMACAFVAALHVYNTCRNRRKLKRIALVNPKNSPWTRLYRYGDDDSFMELTGFDKLTFRRLQARLFDEPRVKVRTGRRPLLDNAAKLGLFLLYLNSNMKTKHLSLIFGIVPSSVSQHLAEMRQRCVIKLRNAVEAKISFPNEAEKADFAAMINYREPTVDNVIGFVDGVSLSIECAEDEVSQSIAYNGYYHDTRCNNVFAFAPTGKIVFACINYPGSWHDSQVAMKLVQQVIAELGNYALCVDQGFARSGILKGKFVGPLSKEQKRRFRNDAELLERHRVYVSLRQASEWGMRALQGTFSRLKTRLTSDKRIRRDIILSVILLHNFRTHYIGLNQIATVFNPIYDQYVNFDYYDRIARYFKID